MTGKKVYNYKAFITLQSVPFHLSGPWEYLHCYISEVRDAETTAIVLPPPFSGASSTVY